MRGRRWYSVGVDAQVYPYEREQLERFMDALNSLDFIAGPVASGRVNDPPRLGIQVSVEASDPTKAITRALDAFEKAAAEAGIVTEEILRAEVMTEDYLDWSLNEPPEQLVGVAEIAGILGVSKQRVSELWSDPRFPRPVAELAAGPVWRLSMLKRFIDEWPRRPGRPRKAEARG
ncbi:MAG TPA: hypothetical protein VGS09_02180 [Actinomycetota bacterium]|nr:hypothetical protein [Actinomycetota bacterium]